MFRLWVVFWVSPSKPLKWLLLSEGVRSFGLFLCPGFVGYPGVLNTVSEGVGNDRKSAENVSKATMFMMNCSPTAHERLLWPGSTARLSSITVHAVITGNAYRAGFQDKSVAVPDTYDHLP